MAKQIVAKRRKGTSPLRNRSTPMLVGFLTPAVLLYLVVFLYPVIRTVVMSFFQVEGVSDPISKWSFNGGRNYIQAFGSNLFRSAMYNLGMLWLVGGVCVMALALLFAVLLTSGMRGKKFFRSVIYLPNLVSAVAMGTMWLYYALSKERYGLLNTILGWFGADNVIWTDPSHKFWSMLLAYCFGMSMLFASKQSVRPIAVGLYNMVKGMQYTNDYGGMFAAVFIVFAPTFVLYLFLSDKIIAGVTGGAIKG